MNYYSSNTELMIPSQGSYILRQFTPHKMAHSKFFVQFFLAVRSVRPRGFEEILPQIKIKT